MAELFLMGILALGFIAAGIRIAWEYERGVVFRLGRYNATKGPGLYWIFPVLDSSRKIDIRTQTVDIERQETITKDSVTIKVNAVLWFKIFDSAKSVISVEDYYNAVYQLALTTLRNIIGQHDLTLPGLTVDLTEIEHHSQNRGIVIDCARHILGPGSRQRTLTGKTHATVLGPGQCACASGITSGSHIDIAPVNTDIVPLTL